MENGGQKGFTMVEMIVVIVVLGILSLFTFQFLGDSVETYLIMSNQEDLVAEAQLAMERMCREVRDANTITTVTATSIEFVKERMADLDVSQTVTFQKSGSDLERQNQGIAGWFTLAGNVKVFDVTDNSNEIALDLTLGATGQADVILESEVYPKNLPPDFDYKNFAGDWEEII